MKSFVIEKNFGILELKERFQSLHIWKHEKKVEDKEV